MKWLAFLLVAASVGVLRLIGGSEGQMQWASGALVLGVVVMSVWSYFDARRGRHLASERQVASSDLRVRAISLQFALVALMAATFGVVFNHGPSSSAGASVLGAVFKYKSIPPADAKEAARSEVEQLTARVAALENNLISVKDGVVAAMAAVFTIAALLLMLMEALARISSCDAGLAPDGLKAIANTKRAQIEAA